MKLVSLDSSVLSSVTGGTLPLPRTKQRDDNGAIVGGRRLPGRMKRTPQVDTNGAITGGRVFWCPYCH